MLISWNCNFSGYNIIVKNIDKIFCNKESQGQDDISGEGRRESMLCPMLTSGLELGVLRLLVVRQGSSFSLSAFCVFLSFRGKKKRISRYRRFFLAQNKTKCWNFMCTCMCVCMLYKCRYWNSCFPAIAVTQLTYGAGLISTFVSLIFSMDPSAEAHLAAECSGTHRLCEAAVIHFV